jgi:putative NIF3 family GTP cyclohydrolase 1 type 2
MTTKKLDAFFRGILAVDALEDSSMNGLQVDNDGSDIKKVAFATDACMETFERAAEAGAGMLFVHHGIFWGKPWPLTASGSDFSLLEISPCMPSIFRWTNIRNTGTI